MILLSLGVAVAQPQEGLFQMPSGGDIGGGFGGGSGSMTSSSSSTSMVLGDDGMMHKQVREIHEEDDGGVHTQRLTACIDGLCKETLRRSFAPPQAAPMGVMQLRRGGRPLLLSMNRGAPVDSPMQMMFQSEPQEDEEMAQAAGSLMGGLMQQLVGGVMQPLLPNQGRGSEGYEEISPPASALDTSIAAAPKVEPKAEPKPEPKAEEPKAPPTVEEVQKGKPEWKATPSTVDSFMSALTSLVG